MRIATTFVTRLVAIAPVLLLTGPADAQRRSTTAAVPPEQVTKLLEVMKLGDTAKDVEFLPLKGEEKVKLSELTKTGPAVLVVLRGYPGYQCPLCSRQVSEMLGKADDFAKLGAKIVYVYPGPGPADRLKELAQEFLGDRKLPASFQMMVDPEYTFTNHYELRWNAPRETSYPSTFVLDTKRVVKFRKISTTHGDRAPTADVLAALTKLQAEAAAEKPAGDAERKGE